MIRAIDQTVYEWKNSQASYLKFSLQKIDLWENKENITKCPPGIKELIQGFP